MQSNLPYATTQNNNGPLENLLGGGGAKYKKIFAQGKIKWKKFMHAN